MSGFARLAAATVIVEDKEDALQCEGTCQLWFHRYCAGEAFAHSNAFLYSYVPHTIKSWNSLSPTLVNAVSLSSFKHLL